MAQQNNGEFLLLWPLNSHTITAGWTYNDGSRHQAIDLRAVAGTPVYAAENGTVDQWQVWDGKTKTGMQSYGNMVRIDHGRVQGDTLKTRYAHLSKMVVAAGQTVKAGQLIGYSGTTGNCYGAHLHFEVWWAGVRRNPLNWLDGDFDCASDAVKVHLGKYTSVVIPAAQTDSINWECSSFLISATGSDKSRLRTLVEELSLPCKSAEEAG